MRWVMGADEHDRILDILAAELSALGHEVTRVGATPNHPAPWGEVALEIARRVAGGDADQGIVCCYTGTGVSMAANKVPGVRAALCVDAETERGARKWNDANVLALSLRLTSEEVAKEILAAWLAEPCAATETEAESLAVLSALDGRGP